MISARSAAGSYSRRTCCAVRRRMTALSVGCPDVSDPLRLGGQRDQIILPRVARSQDGDPTQLARLPAAHLQCHRTARCQSERAEQHTQTVEPSMPGRPEDSTQSGWRSASGSSRSSCGRAAPRCLPTFPRPALPVPEPKRAARRRTAGAVCWPASGLPWPQASTSGSSAASVVTDFLAARQSQVEAYGGANTRFLFRSRCHGELKSRVKTESPAIRTRSRRRKNAMCPACVPGTGNASQSGRPGTPSPA
jgi:hypothetical protein